MTYPYHLYTRAEWGARHPGPTQWQRTPLEAFVHHTDTRFAGRIESLDQMMAHVRAIQNQHMDDNDWSDIGYAFVVFQPGARHDHAIAFKGRALDSRPAAQLGHNDRTLPIAVVGDGNRELMDRNTRFVIESLIRTFGPDVKRIGGHRDVVATNCPGDHFYGAIPQIAAALDLPHL